MPMREWRWPPSLRGDHSIGDTDSNRWGEGIVVGNWGIGSKVEAAGARVGKASVTRWNMRGGIQNVLRC